MKSSKIALFVAGMSLSSLLLAAGTNIPAGGVVTGTPAGACTLLSEDVKLSTSTNVLGAYNCDVPTNTITVGTCHNAGSRNAALKCAVIGQNTTTTPPTNIFNHASCDDQKVADGVTINGTPDFRGFFAQTSGGSVAPSFMNGNCEAGKLAAHQNFN